MKALIVISIMTAGTCKVFSQNLTNIGSARPFSVSGSASVNQIFSSQTSSRNPFAYYASGNLAFDLYGWVVPLSFTFSNNRGRFSQPFNRYALHPTYKSVTAHLGYTSVSYSPYTINGHMFLGAAVDVTVKSHWKFSGLYGRFLKATNVDSTTTAGLSSFDRFGYGFKSSFSSEENNAEFTIFRAEDRLGSIEFVPKDVSPMGNLVVSVSASKRLFSRLIVGGEFALSNFSADLRQGDKTTISSPVTPTPGSTNYSAYKASVQYQFKAFSFGTAFERVDPGYRTLGAYYFNNDLQNLTVNVATVFLKGKGNFSISAGGQRDNINNEKMSTMKRMVASSSISLIPTERLSVNGSFSNFQTYTNIRSEFDEVEQLSPFDQLDTLAFTQISTSGSIQGNYNVSTSKGNRQSITVTSNYQKASDRQGDSPEHSGSVFLNSTLGYNVNLTESLSVFSLALNVNTIRNPSAQPTTTIGPIGSVSKSFFDKKMRSTLSSALTKVISGSEHVQAMNIRCSSSGTLKKKHQLNASIVFVRSSRGSQSVITNNVTISVGYSYSFQTKTR